MVLARLAIDLARTGMLASANCSRCCRETSAERSVDLSRPEACDTISAKLNGSLARSREGCSASASKRRSRGALGPNVPEWVVLQFALAKIGAVLVTVNTRLVLRSRRVQLRVHLSLRGTVSARTVFRRDVRRPIVSTLRRKAACAERSSLPRTANSGLLVIVSHVITSRSPRPDGYERCRTRTVEQRNSISQTEGSCDSDEHRSDLANANCSTTHSGTFGAQSATRSPVSMPRLSNPSRDLASEPFIG